MFESIAALEVSEEERNAILGENAARVMALD
jgi:predicted TIM-barrel fold metal-dependent hydrolase